MRIISFSVENYRSITGTQELPIEDLTVLIGPNNEGKSNLLRALDATFRVLRNYSEVRLSSGAKHIRYRPDFRRDSYNWEKDFPVLLQTQNPDGKTIFSLVLSIEEAERKAIRTSTDYDPKDRIHIVVELSPNKMPEVRLSDLPPHHIETKSVAVYVAQHLNLIFIPTVRTANNAEDVVADAVAKELKRLEHDGAYRGALNSIKKLQEPILDQISKHITDTLREFIPTVRNAKVKISEEAVYRSFRRSCEIIVDDGTPTPLNQKGDGVQSLAALGLIRRLSQEGSKDKTTVLAIEEPESHLHPNAIHQLKEIIVDLSKQHQVLITTHCPSLVNRAVPRSNILVSNNSAMPVTSIKQIREALGVKASDNLQNADIVLIVEGEDDRKSIEVILRHRSKQILIALDSGALTIQSLLGGDNLPYKLAQLKDSLCSCFCFLDHDSKGIESGKKAVAAGLIKESDLSYATCKGRRESEMEDLYDAALYEEYLKNAWGVILSRGRGRKDRKWSDRMRDVFLSNAKTWNDDVKARLKSDISRLVVANPTSAIHPKLSDPIDTVVRELESRIFAIKPAVQQKKRRKR